MKSYNGKAALNDFELIYYDLIYNDLEIDIFEKYVYGSVELEGILTGDDYIDLISLNFASVHIRHDIKKIMGKYIDHGKLEKHRLLSLLYKSLSFDENLPGLLRYFYYLYWDGYVFFNVLGLEYGLTCEVPPNKYKVETWEELSANEQKEIIASFFPKLEIEIKHAIDWLEKGEIILMGTKDEINHWEYIDNR